MCGGSSPSISFGSSGVEPGACASPIPQPRAPAAQEFVLDFRHLAFQEVTFGALGFQCHRVRQRGDALARLALRPGVDLLGQRGTGSST